MTTRKEALADISSCWSSHVNGCNFKKSQDVCPERSSGKVNPSTACPGSW